MLKRNECFIFLHFFYLWGLWKEFFQLSLFALLLANKTETQAALICKCCKKNVNIKPTFIREKNKTFCAILKVYMAFMTLPIFLRKLALLEKGYMEMQDRKVSFIHLMYTWMKWYTLSTNAKKLGLAGKFAKKYW